MDAETCTEFSMDDTSTICHSRTVQELSPVSLPPLRQLEKKSAAALKRAQRDVTHLRAPFPFVGMTLLVWSGSSAQYTRP